MILTSIRQVVSIACALCVTSLAYAIDLIAYEGFEYGSTPNLQGMNGGTGWSGQWFKLSTIPTGVSPESLAWPQLVTKGGCATTAPYPSADFTRYSRALAPYTDPDNVVYISFVVRANFSTGTTAGLAFGSWDNGMVVGACPTGVYGLMTPPYTAHSDTEVTVVEGENALLVARVSLNEDATTTWSLFVDPAVGSQEPDTPDASLTVPIASLPPAVMIYNDGGYSTDEIRVGRTWTSVIPKIGDLNGNGIVNVEDLLAVISSWGNCPGCPADLNGNGIVNVEDLLIQISNWG